MEVKVRILLVEDFLPDAELEKHEIQKVIPESEFILVDTKNKFLEALEHFNPHVIVSDYMMPQFDGMTALKLTLEKTNLIPFILCTGSMNEDTAVDCIKKGATDYIIKEHMKRLGESVKNALEQREVLIHKLAAEEKAKQFTSDQELLLETTTKLLLSTNLHEIYQIVFESICKIDQDSYIVLSSNDPKEKLNKVEFHKGFEKYLKWLDKVFHLNQESLKIPFYKLSKEEIVKYTCGKLLLESDGLFSLSAKSIPREFCRLIEKALSIKEIYFIGFSSNEQQLGLLAIMKKEKGCPKKAEMIEIIMSGASQAIQKFYAMQSLKLNQDRLQSLFEITQFRTNSIQELLDKALDEVVKITDSKIGYIYHYSEIKKEFILNTWSKEVMEQCKVNKPETIYHLDKTGIWGEAVRQRKPIILNDYPQPNPLKKGYPKGHVALKKFLTIPIFKDNAIIAVVGVGNKETDYTQSDINQLTLMMDSVWKIVQQKESDLALFQSNERFRMIHNYSPIGIVLFDENGFLKSSNTAFKEILCLPTSAEVNDFNIFYSELISPNEKEKLFKGKVITLEKEFTIKQLESIFRCKLNRSGKIDLEFSIKAMETNPISHKLEFLLQIQDITERKKVENIKNEFINIVSHEMRTPLTSMRESLMIMKKYYKQNLSEDQISLLDMFTRNIDRLSKLIQNMLDFQKLNSTNLVFNKKPDSLNNLILQMIKDLQTFTINEDLQINTDLEENLPEVIMDSERIFQVLSNLINNAVKFTKKGSVTIRTELESYKDRIKVSVIDTGIGINQEEIRHLFEPFYQVKKDMEHQTGGTGLGLSICKKILEGHDSDLFVISEPGKGSTFYFYLPVAVGREK